MSGRGVLILAGATCSGKTALALELAERFGAEIVGADSRQIYRDMPIGTAAPTDPERRRVPHHLVGFLAPHERYSAARFVRDALRSIAAIEACGRRAIVVGGTGFYVRALAGDVALSPAFDPELRARLAREARLHPPDTLHAWLAARDPARAASIAASDRYRVARALEIAIAADASQRDDAPAPPSLRAAGAAYVKVVLDVPQATLDVRIAERVDAMLAAGLVDEAERVGESAVAADAVGYREALAYLRGSLTEAELRALLIRNTRRYAKRQRTWFRSEPQTSHVAPGLVADAAAAALRWS